MKNKKRGSSSKAVSVQRQIDRALSRRAERKFFDSTVSSLIGVSYGVFALSQPIIQGIGGGQRIGDNIEYRNLYASFRVDINVAALATDIRIIIVLDKMNVGIAPVIGDFLVNTGLTSTYSALQIKEKRFTIVYDKLANITLGGVSSFMVQKVFNLRQKVTYSATTNVVGANGKNSMWLFVVSDQGVNLPGFNMDFQIEFTDL